MQLRELYPKVEVRPIRGNVLTRLEKLDRGEYGALVLAAAGLRRLGLEGRISRYFSPEEMLPAAGQGVLAVQCRAGMEDAPFLACLRDWEAERCALTERAFVRELDGGCSSPVAAYAELEGECITVTGLYVDERQRLYRGCRRGGVGEGEELARALARELKEDAQCREG